MKFSPSVCLVVVFSLTGKVAAICQHVYILFELYCLAAELLLTMLLEQQIVTNRCCLRWRGSLSAEVNENKLGLQSGPGLLLVSRLGFALGQSCFA